MVRLSDHGDSLEYFMAYFTVKTLINDEILLIFLWHLHSFIQKGLFFFFFFSWSDKTYRVRFIVSRRFRPSGLNFSLTGCPLLFGPFKELIHVFDCRRLTFLISVSVFENHPERLDIQRQRCCPGPRSTGDKGVCVRWEKRIEGRWYWDKARRQCRPPPAALYCPQCHSSPTSTRLASSYLFIQRLIGSLVFIPVLRLNIME